MSTCSHSYLIFDKEKKKKKHTSEQRASSTDGVGKIRYLPAEEIS